jgi:ADP-heptose:LPS heptosyltransferase
MLPAERAAAILSSVSGISDAALERTFADPAHPALAHLAALVDDADSEDPALRQPALAALFGGLVEPLNDSFTAAGRAVYAELYARAVWRCCAARTPLRAGLAEFGIHSQEQLLRRYREIRARSLAPIATPAGGDPRHIAVLSRVTIGADILLTSVALARLHQRWPQARLHLIGEAKLAGLFAGLPQVQVEALSYPRRGPLGERLQGWLEARAIVRRITADLVFAPDSRLDQLGILPLIGLERYALWENLLPTGQGENLARRLDHDLALRLDLPDTPQYPSLGLDAATRRLAATLAAALGPGPWAAVKLDHGGNPAKALPRQAEGMLLRELRKRGWRILLDRGFGDAELANSDQLLAAAGLTARDVDQSGAGLGEPLAAAPPLAWAGAEVVRLHGTIAAWAAGVSHCSLAVSYDSVGHHLAAALGVPVVVAFTGFSDPVFPIAWHPCGDSAVWVVEIPTAERGDPAHWFRVYERLPEAPQAPA